MSATKKLYIKIEYNTKITKILYFLKQIITKQLHAKYAELLLERNVLVKPKGQ